MSENENEVRRALDRHWAATQSGDYVVEHEIYHEDVVLDYPQSGSRIVGRDNVRASRGGHPARRRFEIHRIFGSGGVWVTEYIIAYDDRPSYTVSVMEFADGQVTHETQYFADPFAAPTWRARWVEQPTPGELIGRFAPPSGCPRRGRTCWRHLTSSRLMGRRTVSNGG